MRDDLRVGILDGGEDALGHCPAVEVHVGVNRNDHDVELREHFVVEIEVAVLQDIHFAAGEQADAVNAFFARREFS